MSDEITGNEITVRYFAWVRSRLNRPQDRVSISVSHNIFILSSC